MTTNATENKPSPAACQTFCQVKAGADLLDAQFAKTNRARRAACEAHEFWSNKAGFFSMVVRNGGGYGVPAEML